MAVVERSLAPDLARGLMLSLIAVANVMIYLHARPYGLRQHIVEDGALDQAVTAVLVVLVDARAYPLFAALFGYGLARIMANQRSRGLDAVQARAVVRRRALVLVGFGLAHAVLAFSGDILGWYGLLGAVLAARLHADDRILLRAAVVWLVFASAVQGLVYSDPNVSEQRSFLWSFAIDGAAEAAAWRLLEWAMTPFGLLAVVSPLLVGVWAARRGILEHPDRHRPLLRWTAAIGIAAGVIGGIGMALVTIGAWTAPYPVILALSWAHIATGVLCGLGYAAVIALWAARLRRRHGAALPPAVDALRAAGERSLTCYLAQTVVFATLLPAWALGWGATLGTAGAAVLALATWVVTVAGADLLARAGRRGPAEALLRRLAYHRSRGATVRGTIG
ncbi:DUF418 domain-containing protein [Agromyces sp. NPDC049794]|uniref:DUF418 domain-containing protein n=1 Tax=unclassified Agromyces TaxID=2639701 RepID=UPI0033DC6740